MVRALYPPIEPYTSHTVAVDGPHQLYVEECGCGRSTPPAELTGSHPQALVTATDQMATQLA